MTLITWNVNRLNIDTVADHFLKADALFLQELKAKGSNMTTAAGWTICHARPRKNGVAAVAVPAARMSRVLWTEAIGNHIGSVYQKGSENILLVSAYMPTRGRPLHSYEHALEDITVVMTKRPSPHIASLRGA